ncbi:MAG TPA: type II toxin-antitoxin system ParD family antitoxin [Prosthecobacter sp.]|nr:type II toxin-antitoxin system ParD family antitoxin [Prosthecobacter sp.]HRK15796.1 type II toxin-antitoxin system ParD family antitoxin [Prosthecobacter sp.]
MRRPCGEALSITSGRHNNASEVVRAALRKVQESKGESFPPGSLAHLHIT